MSMTTPKPTPDPPFSIQLAPSSSLLSDGFEGKSTAGEARRARKREALAVAIAVSSQTAAPAEVNMLGILAGSIAFHALILLILGLWHFAPKPSQVKTFDTRLAGSEFGAEEGMTNLGGLDTPIAMPDVAPTPPSAEATFSRLKSDVSPSPLAGFAGSTGAGQGDGFGLAKFGNGGEEVRGVAVKVGDPQFTLLWDSKADIDLHVIEPGGKEIYWNDPRGKFGGELDVDNVEGFGPENVYWLKLGADGSKDLGPGPPGEYKWFVAYYGGNGGVSVPTRWKVRVKHEGRVEIIQGRLTFPGSKSKSYSLNLGGSPPP